MKKKKIKEDKVRHTRYDNREEIKLKKKLIEKCIAVNEYLRKSMIMEALRI